MNSFNRILWLLALLRFIIPFMLQSGVYEPHRDEYLYLAEAAHPAWGYMEVPPMLSWLATLTPFQSGQLFWVKCWPSIFGALTFLVSGKIIESLGGGIFALLLCFLSFVLGVYLRVFFLFQPNAPEIFFWTLMAWGLIRYTQTNQNKWLYCFGIAAGLGLLSKYSIVLFITGLLVGLLLTKNRRVFANKHLWFSGGIALLIFLPNLLWQYQHHLPVVFHMRELSRTQLQYVSPASFLIDQILMHLPVFYVWLAGLLAVFFVPAFRPYRFIGWAWLIVIILLLLAHGKNYYALGAYPVLFALGAVCLEQWSERRRFFRWAMITISLILGIWLIPLALPVWEPTRLASFYKNQHFEKTGALKWEDLEQHPLPQDFADMLSWKEMTEKSAKAFNQLTASEKKRTLIFCDNYGEAGAVSYYGHALGLPPAFSDNASFLYWLPANPDFDNLVLVTPDQLEMEHAFIRDFASAKLVDSITNPFARERGTLIILLKGPNQAFRDFFRKKLEADRKEAGPSR
ncbi:MAG: glycosyltransferase family 39 protein [Bacteroidota bacterium]|nr:glycosyltransferase family 39 protein [Bacteroidota bacterium]